MRFNIIRLYLTPHRIHLTLAAALLSAGLSAPSAAQEWTKGRIVVRAGVGAGPVTVGEKLSPVAQTYLGPPSKSEFNSDGSKGYTLYGKGDARDLVKGIRVLQADPKNPEKTTSIEVKGVRASTEDGVFLGGAANLITTKYPQAQKDSNTFTGSPEYVIPGLVMRVKNDKISEFIVQSNSEQAWRFQDLRVTAGQSAGPIVLGKVIPPEAYKLFGEPTFKVSAGRTANSGIVRWGLPGQTPARMIEVYFHDGINPKAVTQVRIRGVAALTDRQIKLGDSAAAAQSIYQEGRTGLGTASGAETWRIPGLTLVLQNGKVVEMQIYKADRKVKN